MNVDEKLAELIRIVARENARQRKRTYSLTYLGGKWINLSYREFGGMSAVDVIKKDTPATVEGASAAIRAMTACIAEMM